MIVQIHDPKIEKPRVDTQGSHKGMSDPVLLFDEDGRYAIAIWDERDGYWHENVDGMDATYNAGIVGWTEIPRKNGWVYDSEFYSSSYNAEEFEANKKAMIQLGLWKEHKYRSEEV